MPPLGGFLGDGTAVRCVTMPSRDPREADATQLHPLVVESQTGHNRRVAAEALFEAMDGGQFDLDPAAVDLLNAAGHPDVS